MYHFVYYSIIKTPPMITTDVVQYNVLGQPPLHHDIRLQRERWGMIPQGTVHKVGGMWRRWAREMGKERRRRGTHRGISHDYDMHVNMTHGGSSRTEVQPSGLLDQCRGTSASQSQATSLCMTSHRPGESCTVG